MSKQRVWRVAAEKYAIVDHHDPDSMVSKLSEWVLGKRDEITKASSRCAICGRKLTSPESIALGFGPSHGRASMASALKYRAGQMKPEVRARLEARLARDKGKDWSPVPKQKERAAVEAIPNKDKLKQNKDVALFLEEVADLPMMERKKRLDNFSRRQRDEIAQPRQTVPARIKELTQGVHGDTVEERTDSMKDRVRAQERKIIVDHMNRLHDDLIDSGVSEETATRVTLEATDTLLAQDVESQRRVLGDHGTRHLMQDADYATRVLDQIPSFDMTPKDRAEMTLLGVYHDTGYLTPLSRMFMDSDHPHWSHEFVDTPEVRDDLIEIFGKDEYKRFRKIIGSHDAPHMDWENNPKEAAFRLADNLALFQKEKLPPFCAFVPQNISVMVRLGKGDIDVESARDQIADNIRASELPAEQKANLLASVPEVSGVLPKFMLGMLGAETQRIGWDENAPKITIRRNRANAELSKVVDAGQKQFMKLAETYGLDPEAFISTDHAEFKEGDKIRLRVDLEDSVKKSLAKEFKFRSLVGS